MKEYVDTLVLALRREMDQRQAMNSQAIEAAASALNHRLEGMNEFRTQTLKSVQALVTYDLGAPESQDFIAAYPAYRKVVLRYGTKPYYVLLR